MRKFFGQDVNSYFVEIQLDCCLHSNNYFFYLMFTLRCRQPYIVATVIAGVVDTGGKHKIANISANFRKNIFDIANFQNVMN
jgi:hypothetical protein